MLRVLVSCLVIAAPSGFAQIPSPLRTSLPSSGPSITSALSQLYQPLLGDWDVRVTDHLPDGTHHTGTGEWHFAWVLEGRAIQDVWISPPRGERQSVALAPAFDRYGTTVRYVDPTIGGWRLTWINPARNYVATLVGRARGADIVQEGSGDEGGMLRWTFYDMTPTSFAWRGEVSTDSGRTWRNVQEMWGRRRRPSTSIAPAASLMDALIAGGPAEETAGALRLFGQFAGSWDASLALPNADGSVTTGLGEIHLGWVLEGRALQDVWIFPKRGTEAGAARGEYGTTIRFFDRSAGNWRSIWISPLNHVTRSFRVSTSGDEIFLDARTAAGDPQRWIFSAITSRSFHWRNIVSSDDGRTWRLREEVAAHKVDSAASTH